MSNVEEKSEYWSGVFSMSMGVSAIMIADFLPSGLLTPIASDLQISEGMAGQMVSVTSFFAVISSLMIASFSKKLDRRFVLSFLSFFCMVSNLIVAFSPNFGVLLFGRILLGIASGGFWALATAVAIRLVKNENIPKALSIILGTASFSSMLAAPFGSLLGEYIGWRDVFVCCAFLGLIGLLWMLSSLPSLEAKEVSSFKENFRVMKKKSVVPGMLAIAAAFCGRFASTTYLRPYFEQDLGLEGMSISLMFLAFDFAYFAGAFYAGKLVSKRFVFSMIVPPLILALTSVGLMFSSFSIVLTTIILLIRGAIFAPIPVVWSSWGPKLLPEQTEVIGGLYVAAVQSSAVVGALLGGVFFDYQGPNAVFAMSGSIWIASSLIVVFFVKDRFLEITNNKDKNIKPIQIQEMNNA